MSRWVRRAKTASVIGLLVSTMSLALVGSGCRDQDAGTKPTATTLPALVVKDDTADLLLTWIDDRGDFHTGQHPADVPDGSRAAVRVVPLSREDSAASELVYVADLTQRKPDTSYTVNTMTRNEWEALAAARREKKIAAVAPHATGTPSAARPGDEFYNQTGKSAVILYGASWCGFCKKAKEHLRRKNVPFTYKDIEADESAAAEMERKLARAGIRNGGVPVLDIGGKMIVGFDANQIDAAVAAASKGGTAL
ncbi:MAG: glutaredoxin family protein [Polyangiaceae bacterium]